MLTRANPCKSQTLEEFTRVVLSMPEQRYPSAAARIDVGKLTSQGVELYLDQVRLAVTGAH